MTTRFDPFVKRPDSAVSVLNARFVLDTAERAGADREALLADVGLDPAQLSDPSGCVDYSYVGGLWDAASRYCDDECFGIHAAERVSPSMFGALWFAVRSCSSGGEALERALEYSRRYFHDTEFALRTDRSTAYFTHRFLGDPVHASSQAADFALAGFVLVSRRFTGVEWEPRSVSFVHVAPSSVDEYRRVFRAKVEFEARENAVAFDRALLDLPLVAADPDLLEVLEPQIEDFLSRVPHRQRFSVRARDAVRSALQEGEATLDAAARALGLSPRTLQRRLREEDTSHREVLEEVRAELASHYLADLELSLDQVAARLGFSEPSAFHRAFRRWTGTTPAAYRARLTEEPEGGSYGAH